MIHWLTKMAHFFAYATETVEAEQLENLILNHAGKLQGTSNTILANH